MLKIFFKSSIVLDLGCGTGTWAAQALKLGAKKVIGVDGPWVDETLLEIDPSAFLKCDLRNGPPNLDENFSFTIWLENAEHLPLRIGENILNWVCTKSDFILFSAAIPGQAGKGHCNEQWQSFWARKFKENGFKIYDFIRSSIWSNTEIPYWYKQNILFYVKPRNKNDDLLSIQEIDDLGKLDLIHPDKWIKQINKKFGTKQSFKLLIQSIREKVQLFVS